MNNTFGSQILVSSNKKGMASPLFPEILTELRKKFSFVSVTGEEFSASPRTPWLALGGDGTLHWVVNELMHLPANERGALCYIPSGTGNDFARSLGLESSNERLPEFLDGQHLQPLSICQCNERYFVNMASGGVFAEVTTETSDTFKGIAGRWSYFVNGLGKLLDRKTFAVEVNGEDHGQILGFFVANARFAGGGVQVSAEADPFSRQFHYLLVPEMPTGDLLRLAVELQKEAPDLAAFPVKHGHTESLHLRFSDDVAINLDGEQVTTRDAKFRIFPEAIRIFAPPPTKN